MNPRNVIGMILRAVAALALLTVGGFLLYGFGAGYFSLITVLGIPLGLPTPWNVVATAVLGAGLLWLSLRILGLRPRLERHA